MTLSNLLRQTILKDEVFRRIKAQTSKNIQVVIFTFIIRNVAIFFYF